MTVLVTLIGIGKSRGWTSRISREWSRRDLEPRTFAPCRRTSIPQTKMFELAKASGFKGYYMMEWDGGPGDPYEGTRRLVEETLKYLG